MWVTAVVFAFVLLLLLIFVLENGQRAEVSFLGAHGTLPMGVALLLAAVFGVLLVALPGTARIVQLRMLDRRPGRQPGDPAGSGPTPSSTTSVIGVPLPSRSPREGG
ncbi:LapA family protein [Micromonospora carbonacea]|uniref:LapA family protein n=1 Tax=Micromonospora carbonacea TaxID=47853 RepID=UPI00371A33FE